MKERVNEYHTDRTGERFQYAAVDYAQPLGVIHVDEFGRSRTTPNKTIGTHYRETCVLHFIVAGRGRFTYGGVTAELSAGQAFVMVPGVPYYYIPDESDPWEYYWVCFDGDGARQLLRYAGIADDPPYFTYHPEDIVELTAFIDKFPYVLHTLSVPDSLAALGKLFDVMARLSRRLFSEPTLSDPVLAAVAFMENNYFRVFDITDLSRRLHLSRPYFTQVFTRETGLSPAAYLTKLRVAKAGRLLTDNPALTIAEIARAVGYDNPARLTKAFVRLTGKTPTAWKK